MQCFHYLSERLKNVSLWENNKRIGGTTNSDSDEGALYNNFTEDQQSRKISRHEIEELQFSQSFSAAIDEAREDANRDIVPKEVLEQSLLEDEDRNSKNWMREESWIFVAHGDINSYDYQMAVYLTSLRE